MGLRVVRFIDLLWGESPGPNIHRRPNRVDAPRPARRRLLTAFRATLVLAASHWSFAPAFADDRSAALTVKAVVVRYASLKVVQPPLIEITTADVVRGYVDAQVQVLVRGNMPEGYTLLLEGRGQGIGDVILPRLADSLSLGAQETSYHRAAPGRGRWQDQFALRFRIKLLPTTAPGQHPWPLGISLLTS